MVEKIKEYKPKCPFCKEVVSKPNKLVDFTEHSKMCLICYENQTHKMIIEYLEGKRSGTFACGEDGCSIIIPERDYLSYRTDEELLEELRRRLEGASDA